MNRSEIEYVRDEVFYLIGLTMISIMGEINREDVPIIVVNLHLNLKTLFSCSIFNSSLL